MLFLSPLWCINNVQNGNLWWYKNPHCIVDTKFQHQFLVNARCSHFGGPSCRQCLYVLFRTWPTWFAERCSVVDSTIHVLTPWWGASKFLTPSNKVLNQQDQCLSIPSQPTWFCVATHENIVYEDESNTGATNDLNAIWRTTCAMLHLTADRMTTLNNYKLKNSTEL